MRFPSSASTCAAVIGVLLFASVLGLLGWMAHEIGRQSEYAADEPDGTSPFAYQAGDYFTRR